MGKGYVGKVSAGDGIGYFLIPFGICFEAGNGMGSFGEEQGRSSASEFQDGLGFIGGTVEVEYGSWGEPRVFEFEGIET